MKELLLDRDAWGGITYLTSFAETENTWMATIAGSYAEEAVLVVDPGARHCIFHLPAGVDVIVSDQSISISPDNPIFLSGQRFKTNAPGLKLDQSIANLYFRANQTAKIIVEFFK